MRRYLPALFVYDSQVTDQSATIVVASESTDRAESDKSGSETSTSDQQQTRQDVYQHIPFSNIVAKDQALALGFL